MHYRGSYPTANQKTYKNAKKEPLTCYASIYYTGRIQVLAPEEEKWVEVETIICSGIATKSTRERNAQNYNLQEPWQNIKLRSADQSSRLLGRLSTDWMLLLFKGEEKQIIFAAGYSNQQAFETSELKQSQMSLKCAVMCATKSFRLL